MDLDPRIPALEAKPRATLLIFGRRSTHDPGQWPDRLHPTEQFEAHLGAAERLVHCYKIQSDLRVVKVVDDEIRELQRRFRSAATPQDYRDVGNRAVAVLEALSRTIYDPTKHLRDGEVAPPVDRTNVRIGRYVEDSLGGAENEEVRGVAKKVSELAHKVKHRPAPTRRDAGIAADSVILLANILRRVDQEF